MAKSRSLKWNVGNCDAEMKIHESMKTELNWWYQNVATQVRHINHGNPDFTIQTDSSKSGWGLVFGDQMTGGRWTKSEQMLHINVLEILAIWFSIRLYRHDCVANTSKFSPTPPQQCAMLTIWVGYAHQNATQLRVTFGLGV